MNVRNCIKKNNHDHSALPLQVAVSLQLFKILFWLLLRCHHLNVTNLKSGTLHECVKKVLTAFITL